MYDLIYPVNQAVIVAHSAETAKTIEDMFTQNLQQEETEEGGGGRGGDFMAKISQAFDPEDIEVGRQVSFV